MTAYRDKLGLIPLENFDNDPRFVPTHDVEKVAGNVLDFLRKNHPKPTDNKNFSVERDGDWDEGKHPREPAGSPEGGQFAGGGGGSGEGDVSAVEHDPEVVDVGGDAWNKATAVKLETEYAAARPKMEALAAGIEGSGAKVEGSDLIDVTPEYWDSMTSDQQNEAEASYIHVAGQEELEFLNNNYFSEGGAVDDAAYELVHDFPNKPEWVDDAMREWRNNELLTAAPPFTNEEILGAIRIDYEGGYGSVREPIITWDDTKLPDLTPGQGTLPGIEGGTSAAALTPAMRDGIESVLIEAFKEQAEEKAPDMTPPDFTEEAQDSAYQFWNEKEDEDKFKWAADHGIVESFQMDSGKGGNAVPVAVPETFDPLQAGKDPHDYNQTQAFARYAPTVRALDIFKERSIEPNGKTEYSDAVLKSDIQNVDNELWQGWVGSSQSPEGHILQLAIAEELGGRFNERPSYTRDVIIGQANSNHPEVGGYAGIKAMVRAKWETTQYMLEQAGITTVQVYRGIGLVHDQMAGLTKQEVAVPSSKISDTLYQKLPNLDVVRNGAISTTTDHQVANGWGSSGNRVVLRLEVPRTAVISVPAYGKNVYHEKEVVVAGTAWKGWDAWATHAPPFEKVPLEKSK